MKARMITHSPEHEAALAPGPQGAAALPEPITIAEWWKNRRDESIRVTLSTYDGRHGCPIDTLRRTLTRNNDGSASGPLAHVLDLLNFGAVD